MVHDSFDVLENPSPSLFCREYLAKGRPALLKGAARSWPAARWTPESFAEEHGDVKVTYETWNSDATSDDLFDFQEKKATHTTTMLDFVRLMRSIDVPSRKVYLAAFELFQSLPQLKGAFESLDPYMGWSRLTPSPVRQKLTVPPFMWMGPAGTLSMLHFDRPHNLFVQLYGSKRFLHIDPKYTSRLYYPHAKLHNSLLHWSPVNPLEPDYGRFPLFRDVPVVETIVEAGDVLFTPPRWWHHVQSLTPSISMNFFWLLPLRTTWAIRDYLYVLGRRRALEALGLQRLLSIVESTA